MIPLRCSNPECRSLRISCYRRPFCRECGTYISPISLGMQVSKREELGTYGKRPGRTRNSVCMKPSFIHTKPGYIKDRAQN